MPMGRHKAAEQCQIIPWFSGRHDCKEKRFLQIGDSLLFSEPFKRLLAGEKYLYFCMGMEAGGKKQFSFPHKSARKYGFSKSTFGRYKDELIKTGFIKLVGESGKITREPNLYEFCLSWKG